MLLFKIDEILSKQGKSRYWLSKQTGISENALGKLCRNQTSRIEFDTIEKICKSLNCTPNDIITSDDPQMQRLFSYYSKLNELNNKHKSGTE